MEETKWLKPSDSGSRIGDPASVQAATRVMTGKGCVLKIVKATFSAGHTVLDSSSDDQLCRYSTTVDMPRRASIKR
jgi:hypothetical protein